MTPAQLMENFNTLPDDAQRRVVELVELLAKQNLRSKPTHKNRVAALADEKFIGIWKDRIDIEDSNAYVREVRKSEWS